MTTKNDVTGDRLTSKVNNKKWDENYDRIFNNKDSKDRQSVLTTEYRSRFKDFPEELRTMGSMNGFLTEDGQLHCPDDEQMFLVNITMTPVEDSK